METKLPRWKQPARLKYMREWHAKNKEKTRAWKKAAQERYAQKHPERIKALKKEWLKNNREKSLATLRKYEYSDKGKGSWMKIKTSDPVRFAKFKARSAVKEAVKVGKLVRQPCEVCGEVRSQGHHPDYTKKLEVKWLCPIHHAAEHKTYARNTQ